MVKLLPLAKLAALCLITAFCVLLGMHGRHLDGLRVREVGFAVGLFVGLIVFGPFILREKRQGVPFRPWMLLAALPLLTGAADTMSVFAYARAQRGEFNVRDFGAKGDGSTDDTVAMAAADTALNAAGSGMWFAPAGTFLTTQPITIYSNVVYAGVTGGSSTIKVANGANCQAFKTYQFDALTGTNSSGGANRFEIRNLTIDGNRANQSTPGAIAQTLTSAATGGTFTLDLISTGIVTGSEAYTVSASTLQTDLRALAPIGSGNITLTGGPLNTTPIVATYSGSLATTWFPPIGVTTSSLTGGSLTATYPHSGDCISIYGYQYKIINCVIVNAAMDGIYSEWGRSATTNTTGGQESLITLNHIYSAGWCGICWLGPHDSQWSHNIVGPCNQLTWSNVPNVYVGASSQNTGAATISSGDHYWGHADSWNLIADCEFHGTNDTADNGTGGVWYRTGALFEWKAGLDDNFGNNSNFTALRIGSTAWGLAAGHVDWEGPMQLYSSGNPSGCLAVNFDNSAGYNDIRSQVFVSASSLGTATSASPLWTGTPTSSDSYTFHTSGGGGFTNNHAATGAFWPGYIAAESLTAPNVVLGDWPANGHGLQWWSFPLDSINGSGALTLGTVYLRRMVSNYTGSISHLDLVLNAGGSGLTSGQNLMGIYDKNLNLLQSSVDQTSAWASSGAKQAALNATVNVVQGQTYWIGWVCNGSTCISPFKSGAGAAAYNYGQSAGTLTYATHSTTGQTSMPSTLVISSSNVSPFWAGAG